MAQQQTIEIRKNWRQANRCSLLARILKERGVDVQFLDHRNKDRKQWRRDIEFEYSEGKERDRKRGNLVKRETEPEAETEASLTQPETETTQTPEEFYCEICTCSFRTKKALATHSQLTHLLEDAGYPCRKSCGRSMKTPQARGAHERTCKGSAELTKAACKEKRSGSGG